MTCILDRAQHGDPKAAEELLPLVCDELLFVNEGLDKFTVRDRQKPELVKLRYFVGLTLEEAAEVLDVAVPTASRWWAYSGAWLCQEIERQRNGEGG